MRWTMGHWGLFDGRWVGVAACILCTGPAHPPRLSLSPCPWGSNRPAAPTTRDPLSTTSEQDCPSSHYVHARAHSVYTQTHDTYIQYTHNMYMHIQADTHTHRLLRGHAQINVLEPVLPLDPRPLQPVGVLARHKVHQRAKGIEEVFSSIKLTSNKGLLVTQGQRQWGSRQRGGFKM